MDRFVLCSIISILLTFPAELNAQQIIAPGQLRISGIPFTCGAIPTAVYPVMGDIATARPGVINLNGPLFFQSRPAVQAFTYAHECAHHLFGSDENIADCWAIRIGKAQGFINEFAIQEICQAVWISPGDWTHFPGPQRCQNMLVCFRQLE